MQIAWFFAGFAALAATSAPAAAGYFSSGAYAASIYVASTSGSGCKDTAGQTYMGVLNYGGIASARAGLRVPLPSLGLVSIQGLNVTQGVGTQSPRGNFTWQAVGVPASGWSLSGTWSASVFPTDGYSLVISIVETYGGCTEHLSVSAARVAAHQS